MAQHARSCRSYPAEAGVGRAPASHSSAQLEVWEELLETLPDRSRVGDARGAVELLARLECHARTGEPVGPWSNKYEVSLGELGMPAEDIDRMRKDFEANTATEEKDGFDDCRYARESLCCLQALRMTPASRNGFYQSVYQTEET